LHENSVRLTTYKSQELLLPLNQILVSHSKTFRHTTYHKKMVGSLTIPVSMMDCANRYELVSVPVPSIVKKQKPRKNASVLPSGLPVCLVTIFQSTVHP